MNKSSPSSIRTYHLPRPSRPQGGQLTHASSFFPTRFLAQCLLCSSPTFSPTVRGSFVPTFLPSAVPSLSPTEPPTKAKATPSPSATPSEQPTASPTVAPTQAGTISRYDAVLREPFMVVGNCLLWTVRYPQSRQPRSQQLHRLLP